MQKTYASLSERGCLIQGAKTALRLNQPSYGVKCTSCAWPDEGDFKPIDFCENGAKAVAFETTDRRVTAEFFAKHSVSKLSHMSDYELDQLGRLTEPMRYNADTDHYEPVSWAEAFEGVARHLRSIDPEKAVFYTAGKVSNEAAFLYQMMVREYGSNNLPDCSNMCHEPTSVGLAEQIGIGKATVIMSDYEHTDLILSFGHNPGTNHPRSLTQIRKAKKNGAKYVAINPIKEPSLIDYRHPQSPLEMLHFTDSTHIADEFVQLSVGGDAAFIAGLCKVLLSEGTLDHEFIEAHTSGFDEFAAWVHTLEFEELERVSGVSEAQMRQVAQMYDEAKACIAAWGMGITQHEAGVDNIHMIVNLLLLKGNIGKPGAGCLPVRGHSNVQGNRTMGIHEQTNPDIARGMRSLYGLESPTENGFDVSGTLKALNEGAVSFFMSFAGNFAKATPDWQHTCENLKRTDMTVQVAISLNRSALAHGKQAYLLPVLARTEADFQASGFQTVSSEDSMCNITPSRGFNRPASDQLMSEPALVCQLAKALNPDSKVNWEELQSDYSKVRDLIGVCVPGHSRYNERLKSGRGFYLGNSARERLFKTKTHKARFMVPTLPLLPEVFNQEGVFKLTTLRAHGQFNTTIYNLDDRYRGVFGERDVLFMCEADMQRLGLVSGDKIDVQASFKDSAMNTERKLVGYKVRPLDMPAGSVAAYYPEANVLVPFEHHAKAANTPAYKSVPVILSRSA